MYFASDNWAGAHPRIAEALTRHSGGFATPYGASTLDRQVEALFSEIFEREVAVFFIGTGTAANALAFAAFNRPGGVFFCHRDSHVFEDECGAPEFYSHGARLAPVDGGDGRIDPDNLRAEIARFPSGWVPAGQKVALSITQATEVGTVYDGSEIEAIAAIAREHGLPLHMDGARFANALVRLGMTPAEMTWKRGVDVLSFGGTKNGCWCAEALVFMNPDQARELPYLRKRAGQLFSKSRFVAAQFEAYFNDGLWLDLARHSNAMAARLSAGVESSTRARLGWRCDANEVFAILPRKEAERARAGGAVFRDWTPPRGLADQINADEVLIRLVASFATTQEDVDGFLDLIA